MIAEKLLKDLQKTPPASKLRKLGQRWALTYKDGSRIEVSKDGKGAFAVVSPAKGYDSVIDWHNDAEVALIKQIGSYTKRRDSGNSPTKDYYIPKSYLIASNDDIVDQITKLANDNPNGIREYLVPLLKEAARLPKKPELLMQLAGDGASFKFYKYFLTEGDAENQKEATLKEFMTIVEAVYKKYGGKKRFGFPQPLKNIELRPSSFSSKYPYLTVDFHTQEPIIITPVLSNRQTRQDIKKLEGELKSLVGRFSWVVDLV